MTNQNNDNQFTWPNGTQPNKGTNVPSILVAIILTLLLVVILGFYIYLGMKNTPASVQEAQDTTQNADTTASELTEEEKMRRLEALPKNPNPLSEEEKINRLQAIDSNVQVPLEDQLNRLENSSQ